MNDDLSTRAARLHREALVWDSHACLPLHPDADVGALARHKGLLEAGDGVGSAREAFAAELRDTVRRVNIVGEIAGEPVQVVPPPVPQPSPAPDHR